MAECLDKNMIDKDEYPQTRRARAPLRRHARRPLARAGRRPRDGLLDDRLQRGVHARRAGAQAPLAQRAAAPGAGDRPNLVMGANVQVCWEKFCRYWDVEPRLVPVERRRDPSDAPTGAAAHCDENTIGVVAILGSTFDGSYEPVAEIAAALDDLAARARHRRPDPRRRRLRRLHRAVPGSGPGVGLPVPRVAVDQRLGPQVRPRLSRASAGSLWRDEAALPGGAGLRRRLPRRRACRRSR